MDQENGNYLVKINNKSMSGIFEIFEEKEFDTTKIIYENNILKDITTVKRKEWIKLFNKDLNLDKIANYPLCFRPPENTQNIIYKNINPIVMYHKNAVPEDLKLELNKILKKKFNYDMIEMYGNRLMSANGKNLKVNFFSFENKTLYAYGLLSSGVPNKVHKKSISIMFEMGTVFKKDFDIECIGTSKEEVINKVFEKKENGKNLELTISILGMIIGGCIVLKKNY